jgi:hypothetical protein
MPKNKRPNRRPGAKKVGAKKPAADPAKAGGAPETSGGPPAQKTFGPSTARSPIRPAMSRRSSRGR